MKQDCRAKVGQQESEREAMLSALESAYTVLSNYGGEAERAVSARIWNVIEDAAKAESASSVAAAPAWRAIDEQVKASGETVLLLWDRWPAAPMHDVGFWHSREKAWCDTHQVLHNQESHPTHWMPLPRSPRAGEDQQP